MGKMVAPRDVDAAIGYYEKSARLHDVVGSTKYYANTAWLTVGELLAQKYDYTAAINHFEWLVHRNAPKFNAGDEVVHLGWNGDVGTMRKGHFRAVLCYLCRDGPSAAERAVDRFANLLPTNKWKDFDGELEILRQAMGYAENRFTAENIERTLQQPAMRSPSGGYGPRFGGYTGKDRDATYDALLAGLVALNKQLQDMRGGSTAKKDDGTGIDGSRKLTPWTEMMLVRALRMLRDMGHEARRHV
ncbi:uncharacterized protein LOC129593179 [Paramacrobiotus metropolitanus]|uniref:uncharacterized protein LOC129593179 n=1 Tax=Paramacrobiotus metropolitanus TaxID=2943436 RepID=UPI002445E3A0|nr:uncharacterized protein LOC129593179 [Paramacrobiotus metropolitanus]